LTPEASGFSLLLYYSFLQQIKQPSHLFT
jgi:hypothetical protein